jgi:hypothetical protein
MPASVFGYSFNFREVWQFPAALLLDNFIFDAFADHRPRQARSQPGIVQ